MYIILTQCFASRVGGIESLVTNLALSIGNNHKVKVFADQHLVAQDEIFDSENKNILTIYRYSGIKFFRRRKKARDIKFFIENNKVDGIISDTWKSLELCIDSINSKNIPTICLAHGNELIYNNDSRKKRISYTFNKIKNIVANSRYTSELLRKIGLDEKKIYVINPGVKDIRRIKIEKTFNFSGKPILLTLARLDKRKGHLEVLYSIKKLKKDFPKLSYIIAGEGSEKLNLLKIVKELKIEDHVHFIGNINEKQKKEIFELTSLMVMPTLDDSNERSIEGFGISYIEAAMFGICSVANDVGGVGDAIIHNETGILLKSNEDLYLSLKNILSDELKLKKLGNNAKERALKDFNWENISNKCLDIFKTTTY